MFQEKTKLKVKAEFLGKILFVSAFLILASKAQAGVEISEVAWMGSTLNSADEWIELYNSGSSAVNLEGWNIFEGGGAILIEPLAGTISPGEYFLVERSDDDTVPGISASQPPSPWGGNGLHNDGEFLVLKDSSGQNIDQIDASAGWPAGDPTNKDTMQKVAGAWQTLSPTPKAPPPGGSSIPPPPASAPAPPPPPAPPSSAPLEPNFKSAIKAAFTGVAGADIIFEGKVYNKDGQEMNAERYLWSFGDGAAGEGRKVLHAYKFPGKYYLSFSAKIDTELASAYEEIEILPNRVFVIEVSAVLPSWIKLSNSSSQKINLGYWLLRTAGKSFSFPAETYILPGAELIVAEETSGLKLLTAGTVEFLYPNGSLAQRFDYGSVAAKIPENPNPIKEVSISEPEFSLKATSSAPASEFLEAKQTQPALLSQINLSKNVYLWGLASLGVGILAALGFLASRRL